MLKPDFVTNILVYADVIPLFISDWVIQLLIP